MTTRATPESDERVRIEIQGPVDTFYSLGIVNRRLAGALAQRADTDVRLVALARNGASVPDAGLLADEVDLKPSLEAGPDLSPIVAIRNLYPPRLDGLAGKRQALFYFAWEDSRIPLIWADEFNRYLDGVMVPSQHVRGALRRSGVALPIRIVHYGVDDILSDASSDDSVLEIPTRKSFKFVHVGTGFPRKGCELLLRAYAAEFTAADDVCLVVKTLPQYDHPVAQQVEWTRRLNWNCPEIVSFNREFSAGEMRALYRQASCLVHAVRAEGFGLPVAEAMLARIPVIVTNYSGLTEFCNDDTACLIDYSLSPSKSPFRVEGAEWASPNEQQLRAAMRAAYERRDERTTARRVDHAERNIRERFTWTRTAEGTVQFIRELEDARNAALALGMVSTWNARCGIAEYSRTLIDATVQHAVAWRVLAAHEPAPIRADDETVCRCWDNEWPFTFDSVVEEASRRQLDAVHLQWHLSQWSEPVEAAVRQLQANGCAALATFHSTRGARLSRPQVEGLRALDRIFIHTDADRELLSSFGIRDTVTLLPHGFAGVLDKGAEDDLPRSVVSSPVVATFGFLRPHKGTLNIIRAMPRLRRSFPGITLLALVSRYPDAASEEYEQACRLAIQTLNLDDSCQLMTEFLPATEIASRLRTVDVIVLPCERTVDSASGAARSALESGRPVVTTRQPMFDDLADSLHQISSARPRAIAAGVTSVLTSPDLAARLRVNAARRIARDDWQTVGRMYLKFVRGTLDDRRRQN